MLTNQLLQSVVELNMRSPNANPFSSGKENWNTGPLDYKSSTITTMLLRFILQSMASDFTYFVKENRKTFQVCTTTCKVPTNHIKLCCEQL